MQTFVDKKHRISWLNLSLAYILAAKKISDNISNTLNEKDKEWENQVTLIPFLFLLRHALELAIKSIYISHNTFFEKEHNLQTLLNGAKAFLDLRSKANQEKWNEITSIVSEFSETKYGGKKRLFDNDDLYSASLKYVQTGVLTKYEFLREIDHEEILKKVKRARTLCEAFTLLTDTKIYVS